MGTTITAGCGASLSGGRRLGTTIAAGYNVEISGGRPEGTTLAAGYMMLECRVAVQRILL